MSTSVPPGTINPVQYPEMISRDEIDPFLKELKESYQSEARNSQKKSDSCVSVYTGKDKHRQDAIASNSMAECVEAIQSSLGGDKSFLATAYQARRKAAAFAHYKTDKTLMEEDRLSFAAVLLAENPEMQSAWVERGSKYPGRYFGTDRPDIWKDGVLYQSEAIAGGTKDSQAHTAQYTMKTETVGTQGGTFGKGTEGGETADENRQKIKIAAIRPKLGGGQIKNGLWDGNWWEQ